MSIQEILARWPDELAACLASTGAVVLGLFDLRGRCVYGNAALRQLLGGDKDAEEGDLRTDYLIAPGWSTLLGDPDSQGVVYQGWLTFEGPELESRSVRGRVLRQHDWLLLLAAYDVDELEDINQRLFDLNKEVTRLQRELVRKNAALQKRTQQLSQTNQALQETIAKRERVEAALWESEVRYRILSELSSDYAYSIRVEADGRRIQEWDSDGFFAITGYKPSEICDHGSWHELVHPDDVTLMQDRVASLYGGEEVEADFRIIDKAGEVRWLRDYASPVWDAHEQRVIRIYGATQDVTQQKQAEAQKAQLALEQEKAQILQRFVVDVSHEFRTPLSVIHSSLELLERTGAQSSDTLSKRVNRLKQATLYISDLIDAMLTMTKLDSAASLESVPVAIDAIVASVGEGLQPEAAKHDVELTVQLAAPSPRIAGSSAKLKRAVQEIVKNAVQFTPQHGQVVLRTLPRTDHAIIEVRDTGVGIRDEDLPLIFDRFYRADSARTTRHTGLGLSIAQRIIALHGGRIEVASEIDKGSTFKIILPLAEAPADSLP